LDRQSLEKTGITAGGSGQIIHHYLRGRRSNKARRRKGGAEGDRSISAIIARAKKRRERNQVATSVVRGVEGGKKSGSN